VNIWTVIQARLGSTRLPRKVLLPFGGGLLIDAVVERASQLGYPVALAIPSGDVELARKCIGREWIYVEGSEDDVLARYVDAARVLDADHVVRVTADCPFLDVEAGRWTIREHVESGADFTAYVAEGRGVEVFSRWALEYLNEIIGLTPYLREHPDEHVLLNPQSFKTNFVKFSVDTEEELDIARGRIGSQGERTAASVGVHGRGSGRSTG
jgi:spore coat polysaccharide biosynthesis protein SpsF